MAAIKILLIALQFSINAIFLWIKLVSVDFK